MKKPAVFTLAAILMFSFTVCDGNSGAPSAGNSAAVPSASQGRGNTGGVTVNRNTIAGYLAEFELTEDILKLPHFTRFDTDNRIGDSGGPGEIVCVNVYVSKKVDDTAKRAWIERIISELQRVSDSGAVNNVMTGKELTKESVDYSLGHIVIGGNFIYRGKSVSFMFSVLSGGVDAENPNDAQAAATFEIEWA